MTILAVIIATPLAIWLIDKAFYRGEFIALVLEVFNVDASRRRRKSPKRMRIRITTAK